jgi:hypothetical protein
MGIGCSSMEEAADQMVRPLYDTTRDRATGERTCALVRLFKTHPFETLQSDLQAFATKILGRPPESPAMKCLTLLATAGDRPEWNSRRDSAGHQAIPLASEKLVGQAPMISNLILQFGLEIRSVVQPNHGLFLDLEQKSFNVFHVAEARGSPYLPAQEEFVIPCGIRSVLGFGGILPAGDLFAIILFSKVFIPRETAGMFKTLALSAKLAILPFVSGPIFAGPRQSVE